MNKKKLYLFTDGFPYGKGEKPFIIPEINILKDKYDLTIVSRVRKSIINDKANITKLHDSINNILLNEDNKVILLWYAFISIFDICFWNDIIEIFKSKKNIPLRIFTSVKMCACAKRYYYLLKKTNTFSDIDNSIYYTFWNNHMTLALCWYKRKCNNMKLVSRIHRYDMFNERTHGNRQPYKCFMNKYENAIVFISEQGKDYYINNYKNNIGNIHFIVSYLGIKDFYVNETNKSANWKLVSCSNVISLKRVNYIIDALSDIPPNVTIDWVHFGDGDEMNNIVKFAKEKLDNKWHINYKFFGHINNKDIIEYYKNNYVNCFITTTSSEGLPVSIMEALMFRIPIIATNVGGIKEQFNNNGVLLKPNPTIDEVMNAILYMYNNDSEEHRINSRKLYEDKFNIDKNIKKLIDVFEGQYE